MCVWWHHDTDSCHLVNSPKFIVILLKIKQFLTVCVYMCGERAYMRIGLKIANSSEGTKETSVKALKKHLASSPWNLCWKFDFKFLGYFPALNIIENKAVHSVWELTNIQVGEFSVIALITSLLLLLRQYQVFIENLLLWTSTIHQYNRNWAHNCKQQSDSCVIECQENSPSSPSLFLASSPAEFYLWWVHLHS